MASVNKVMILGNLGQDPEVRYTASGMAVCTMNVATTDVRTDKAGQRQENTEWHRIIVWNKQAENCGKYLKKGRSVFVEGRLQTRSWDDKNGQKRYTTEIVASTVQFVGGSRDSATNSNNAMVEPSFSPNFREGLNDDLMTQDLGGASLDDIPF
jgi:single-strand DNA-binding protein